MKKIFSICIVFVALIYSQSGLGLDDLDGDGLVCDDVTSCDDSIACTIDRCSEERRECVNSAPDVDGDGHRDSSCLDLTGEPLGDDCNDRDANRYPGNREVCDSNDHDEDCNPRTFGTKDEDGDGHIDVDCGNWESYR